MGQAAAYNRSKNFTDDAGSNTDHPAINAELDNAASSINQLRANIALIQADDGSLKTVMATPGAVSPYLPALGGNALYFLRVNGAETFYEHRPPALVRGDISAAIRGANGDITSLSGLTTPLSTSQGGTGGITPALARAALGALAKAGDSLTGALNEARATVVGNATTSDIWGAAGNSINLTGTLTFIAFPAAPQAGAKRWLYPAPGAVFVNSATFDILGGADFTVAAGSIVYIEAITTTTFKLIPIRGDGRAVFGGINFDGVVPAPITTTWTRQTAAGKFIYVNAAGATTQTVPLISSVPAGTAVAYFNYGAGQATITRQGTDAFAGANTTAASLVLNTGESAIGMADGGATWFWMVHKAGKTIGQIVAPPATSAVATGTTIMPWDDTIPQSTEGDQYMSATITPQNAGSTLVIEVVIAAISSSVANDIIAALFQDATASALAAEGTSVYTASAVVNFKFTHIMAAGTTAATTFKVRAGGSLAGTTTFNGATSARKLGGVLASRITITEILP